MSIKVFEKAQGDPQSQFKGCAKEIEVYRSLKCENIVKFYTALHTENHIYVITEFCEGGDFEKYIFDKGKLPEQEAIGFLSQLVRGYQDLYSKNIVHRDLKPSNLLLKNGVLKISDFGLAKCLDQRCQAMTSFLGSPLYMSPQILQNEKYTISTDV